MKWLGSKTLTGSEALAGIEALTDAYGFLLILQGKEKD